MAKARGYLLFVSKPSGYELAEGDGEPPATGSTLEQEQARFLVVKVAPSPLPDDDRPCAYLERV